MSDLKVFLELGDQRLDVRQGANTIGRSRRCDVVVPDGSISRNHALLSLAGERATLQDLESSNGTYLNGWRLVGEVDLADGDLVMLGETELRVRMVRGEPGAVPMPRDYGSSPSRSEAVAVGDILPVGEVLASHSQSRDLTGPLDVPPLFEPSSSIASAATPTKGVVVKFPGPVSAPPPFPRGPEPRLPEPIVPPPSVAVAKARGPLEPALPPPPPPSPPSPAAERGELLPSIDDLDRVLQAKPGTAQEPGARKAPASGWLNRLTDLFRRK